MIRNQQVHLEIIDKLLLTLSNVSSTSLLENIKMDVNRDAVSERKEKIIISYSKQFVWEIENFAEWWPSRPVAESFRSNTTTWEVEVGVGQPKSWEQALGSPFFTFDINGDSHQFRMDVLRFDSWDRFDDEHNQVMGISLFYAGPWNQFLLNLVSPLSFFCDWWFKILDISVYFLWAFLLKIT